MGKYLDIARKFEAERKGKQGEGPAGQQQSPTLPSHRVLYREMAEAVRDDCFLIDPSWLLDHPEFYGRIKALDDQLTAMERRGASELEYRTA